MTNAPNFISQSEPPEPKEIMADNKIRSNFYFLSIRTGASVTQEKRIPLNKKNMKSLTMSPRRKDPISNKDIDRLTIKRKVFHHN